MIQSSTVCPFLSLQRRSVASSQAWRTIGSSVLWGLVTGSDRELS
jgi:hypothetical protein